MKDIHSHILYGIDDGALSLEESIRILKKAYDNGYTDIVLTPHYRKINGFTCNNENKKKVFENLKSELKKTDIKINIYLANEIAIDEDLFYNLEINKICTINNSKYLLIELPFNKEFTNLKDYIYSLQEKGYKVIIVHPERYLYYKNTKVFEELINMGVLFQGNFASLYGKWGKKSEKTLKLMLKRHMIHFLGSDVHHSEENSYSKLKDLIPLLEELTKDKNMVNDLIDKNIEKVINNKEVKSYKIIGKDNFIERMFR